MVGRVLGENGADGKKLLRKSVGKQVLNRDELETALIDIEFIINSRPLTYIADDVGEPRALTPNQLLLGHKATRRTVEPLPPIAATQASRDELLAMDRARQAQVLEWWRRWQKDILQELSNFLANGRTSKRKIQLGEVVVIHKDHTKRIKWKTGVVIGLDPGKDGVVRRVLLRTSNGKFIDRPVQRLHPIEVHDDNVMEQPANPIPPTAAAAATAPDEAQPDNPTEEESYY